MVYQIFSNGIDRNSELENTRNFNGSKQQQQQRQKVRSSSNTKSQITFSKFANSIIYLIKILLHIFDLLTLPLYFLAQQFHETRSRCSSLEPRLQRRPPRTQQVSANTWIRSLDLPPTSDCKQTSKWKFMGSTLDEVFANSVHEFNSRPCLGYRALVSCPIICQDECGRPIVREQSFRSDFTWYTYGQIGRRVQDLASGLYYYSLLPTTSRALYLASSCLEWFCMAQACFQLHIQLILLPNLELISCSESNQESLRTFWTILDESRADLLVVTCDQLTKLCQLLQYARRYREPTQPLGSLSKLIIIDWQFVVDLNDMPFVQLGKQLRQLEEESLDRQSVKLLVLSIGQVEEAGIENPIELRCSRALSDEENFHLINSSPNQTAPAPTPTQSRKVSDSPTINKEEPVRPSGWLVGGEPISTSMSEPPLRRRQHTGAGLRPLARRRLTTATINNTNCRLPVIEGDNWERLETEVLNAYRNFDSPLDGPLGGHASAAAMSKFTPTPTPPTCDSNEWLRVSTTHAEPKPEDAAVIAYTYGQLGQLKAIVMTHKQLVRGNQEHFLDQLVGGEDVHCATLALDRIVELMVEICLVSRGASIAYSNNLSTLFYDGKELFERDKSDLETANPTFLLVRPYILERLRSSVQTYLQLHLSPVTSFILRHVVYDYKKYWSRRNFATPLTDRLFCAQLKRLFGTKIDFVLCDGLCDCTETKEFFTYMLDLPVIESYGPDEAVLSLISGNDCDNNSNRTSTNSVDYLGTLNENSNEEEVHDFGKLKLMPPTSGTDAAATNVVYENYSRNIVHAANGSLLWPTSETRIRLEDWEEFRLTDVPYPRGQLVVGGEFVSRAHCVPPIQQQLALTPSGAVVRQLVAEKAKVRERIAANKLPLTTTTCAEPVVQCFTTDHNMGISWLRTGDIARTFPNGSFEIISAISNLIKMVDGQFVSLSQIEHILRNSQFVENVCALCGEQRTFVINLVVPNLRRLALKSPNDANLKMAIGTEPEPEELADVEFRREVCNDRLMSEFVADHLRQLLANSGLASITNRFLLVPEIWTPESELVTAAFEPKRDAIRKFYANDIQALIQLEHRTGSWRLSANRRNRNKNNRSPGRRK